MTVKLEVGKQSPWFVQNGITVLKKRQLDDDVSFLPENIRVKKLWVGVTSSDKMKVTMKNMKSKGTISKSIGSALGLGHSVLFFIDEDEVLYVTHATRQNGRDFVETLSDRYNEEDVEFWFRCCDFREHRKIDITGLRINAKIRNVHGRVAKGGSCLEFATKLRKSIIGDEFKDFARPVVGRNIGAVGGAYVGGAIGSFIGPVGTLFGAFIGFGVGAIGGALIGGKSAVTFDV